LTSFTLEQMQRVSDIYARYVGVRRVRLALCSFKGMGRARFKPRLMKINPLVLGFSRRRQIALIVHELNHFKTPKARHAKRWKKNTYLWASAFQMRHSLSDNAVEIHIHNCCVGLNSYRICEECKSRTKKDIETATEIVMTEKVKVE